MTDLAILVPVLHRPHRVAPLLDSIATATPAPTVLFIAEDFDIEEVEAIGAATTQKRKRLMDIRLAILKGGANYARKINYAVRTSTEPLLFFGADDLDFKQGWLPAALEKLGAGIGVVSTNDLCNSRNQEGKLGTHCLVTREYCELGTIDETDKVLHEGYRHEFVDQEFTETAMRRQAFAYAPDSIVEHLHPQVGKAPMDALYAKQRDRMRQGRRVYARRRHLWKLR